MTRIADLRVTIAGCLLALSGCSPPTKSTATDGVTTYQNPIDVPATYTAVGLGIVASSVWVIIGAKKPATQPLLVPATGTPEDGSEKPATRKATSPNTVRAIGLLFICGGLWIGVAGGVGRYNERITLRDNEMIAVVGMWPWIDHVQLTFTDITSITTRVDDRGVGKSRKVRRYADIVHRSGRAETISVDNMMYRQVWPDIVTRARSKGVRVGGDDISE